MAEKMALLVDDNLETVKTVRQRVRANPQTAIIPVIMLAAGRMERPFALNCPRCANPLKNSSAVYSSLYYCGVVGAIFMVALGWAGTRPRPYQCVGRVFRAIMCHCA